MLNIVLYEPEIPQNTGNIMRTCAVFGCKLHLIEPLGFYMDEKHLKRAGMDYIEKIDWKTYPNWDAFLKENQGTFYFMTRYGKKSPDEFTYDMNENLYLVFGKESTGIDKAILKQHLDTCVRIPMKEDERCLNLSNTVAILVYEVMRQNHFDGLSRTESIKGEDFLEDLPL